MQHTVFLIRLSMKNNMSKYLTLSKPLPFGMMFVCVLTILSISFFNAFDPPDFDDISENASYHHNLHSAADLPPSLPVVPAQSRVTITDFTSAIVPTLPTRFFPHTDSRAPPLF
jgi:hypothetical protein